MDNFFKLRADRQRHIIDAALVQFGRNGYKKTSIADIAEQAGIAKGMVSYYFGSKKNLYLYLAEFCAQMLVEEIGASYDKTVIDFFDRIKMLTEIKMAVIKRQAASVSFMAGLYLETDPAVYTELKAFIKDGAAIRDKWIADGADLTKFHSDVDPKLLERFLVWAGEGMAKDLSQDEGISQLEASVETFYRCLDSMKKYFYKEETPCRD